jgi:SAM-dependent methyltransferase
MRMMYDRTPFAAGVGIDRARKSIAYAEANKGSRPLRYELGDSADAYSDYFDFAISTAVIYLIQDLAPHAKSIFNALKPGGVYYAQHPDYSAYPNQAEMVRAIDSYAAIPTQLNTMDQIAQCFANAGFKVAVRRIPPRGFIPFTPGGMWYSSIYDKMAANYDHAYMFKLTKPV